MKLNRRTFQFHYKQKRIFKKGLTQKNNRLSLKIANQHHLIHDFFHKHSYL